MALTYFFGLSTTALLVVGLCTFWTIPLWIPTAHS